MHRSTKVQCLGAAGFFIAMYALNVCRHRVDRPRETPSESEAPPPHTAHTHTHTHTHAAATAQHTAVAAGTLSKSSAARTAQVEGHLEEDDDYEAMCDITATVRASRRHTRHKTFADHAASAQPPHRMQCTL